MPGGEKKDEADLSDIPKEDLELVDAALDEAYPDEA